MSNNSAATSSLAIAQKTVKQLRLEASVRRIKVGLTSNLRRVIHPNQSCHRMCAHHLSIKYTNALYLVKLDPVYINQHGKSGRGFVKKIMHNSKSFLFQLRASSHLILVTSGLQLEVIRKACECDFVVKRQQTEFSCAHRASFVDCAAAV